ncbi:hypothetical protein AB0M35_14665 [Micromonospora sp. NPDC051196]|uniref:DUF7800 domain-containing protein n=1 Tax=Micromonospora sp. NPDC051196 TaxID=3155281 RepID=UPI003418E8FB
MTWQPRPLAGLPLVLAGPLLRRVDSTSVTVWLALREPRKVTLRVYSSDADGAGVTQVCVGSRNTVKVAAHCHLVAVTATAAAPLEPGTLYRYDVFFGAPGDESVPVPATEPRLYSPNVVATTASAARAALSYAGPGAPSLPSFATPPQDLNRLRVVHTSCRKPHGGGDDALAVLDEILRADAADPLARPQQLVLSGSQIYADDVADPLLPVITGLGQTLQAGPEVLPGVVDADPRLRPGHRQELATGVAGLTATAAKSHLLTLAEFWAMYLLVWSDVLWPEKLPEFADVHPDEHALLERSLTDSGLTDAWGAMTRYGPAKQRRDTFDDERAAVQAFRSSVGAVRRVLANTPTYLVLGEHEVSEDWFSTQRWAERALATSGDASGLGRRVIQNALTAYALCQAWGNTPERFAPAGPAGEPGRRLLAAVSAWDGTENDTSAAIGTCVGLPTGFNSGVPLRPAGALSWHYHVEWASHQLIVLDTRTTRVFVGGPDDPPALLYGDAAFKEQVLDPPDLGPEAATFVVSAAPVVGYPFVSDFVQQLLGKRYRGRATVDGEAWGLHRAGYEKLLSRLVNRGAARPDGTRRQRLILLSGEVGYGFAARLRYEGAAPFRATAPVPTRGVLAQFVASAARNEDGLTRFLHGTGFDVTADVLPRSSRVGWANPAGGSLTVGTELVDTITGHLRRVPWTVHGSPAVAETGPLRTVTRTPDWSYDLSFVKHDADDPTIPPRPGSPRPVYPPTGDRSAALGQYLAATENHDDYLGKWGDGKEVVGYANIGEVSLSWQPGNAKKAIQTLWWRLPGQDAAAPLTRCVVSLSTRAAGAPHDPDHLVLMTARPAVDGVAVTGQPAEDAWVYWRTGSTVRRLRASTDGYLYASAVANSSEPWDYTEAFKPAAGSIAEVAYSTGARPLPDALLGTAGLFQQRTVPPVPPPVDGEREPVAITLPTRLLNLVSPEELALWPLLWHVPDTYATDGLLDGPEVWTATDPVDGTPAPAAVAPHRPVERGLRIEGQVDAAATQVRLRLQTSAGVALRLRTGIAVDAPTADEVTATLAPADGGVRTFTATVFLVNAAAAFGPVEVLVVAEGPQVPHVESFTLHLCGLQTALVDDPTAQDRGPLRGEADELQVVDFLRSPQNTVALVHAETRVRRMVPYRLRNERRPLVPGGPDRLQPQMPMWMGEVQFVGVTDAHLRDLLRRRYTRSAVLDPPDPAANPAPPQRLRIDWTWNMRLSWDGPDDNADAVTGPVQNPQLGHNYRLDLTGSPTVVLHYGATGQFTDAQGRDLVVDAQGRVPAAFAPAPTPVPFPVANRRLPAVLVTGQQRPWGRLAGAEARPALVLEFQPAVIEDEREVIRGGDGRMGVSALSFDERPLDPGLIADAQGVLGPPPTAVPLLALPDFRILGQNPVPNAEVEAVIDDLVEEYYTANQAIPRVSILSLACWRRTAMLIFSHESGIRGGYNQFHADAARVARYQYQAGIWRYGHEKDMPLLGPPHGYGVAQLDNWGNPPTGCNPNEVWSWVENVRTAVRLIFENYGAAAYGVVRDHLPNPIDQRTRAVFQRETIRRYNGGREFRWIDGTWQVQPTWQYQTTNEPASGPNPRLLYPNQVLAHAGIPAITYYTNAAGAANVADGIDTVYNRPAAFTAAHYGPETA